MRVITDPGTWYEKETTVAGAVQVEDWGADDWVDAYKFAQRVAEQQANLIDLLVSRGVLTLADCQVLGAPYMEKAE